ncbi:MAG: Nif3-like dinuclear metal center hexameric protein [Solirubrobacterales bacterium]|nr:Nif3-like dinuclear metal center hexameric protein [Solirubrobacterales bacterium]
MASRNEVIEFCDDLLEIGTYGDYGPNGLQVPGAGSVTRVATAVSAHLASIEAAVDAGAELLLSHHGLFWDFHPRALTEAMAARLKVALDAGLSVAGYHLPLDGHPEIGNNVLTARQLGFEPVPGLIGEVKGRHIGTVARRRDPVSLDQLVATISSELGREPLVFDAGPDRIGSIGVVTGAGASDIHEAIALGLDAYITGEPSEHAMADAREGGIHFIAAGHYATEICGINRLGELVAERFGVDHRFIDIPNPI